MLFCLPDPGVTPGPQSGPSLVNVQCCFSPPLLKVFFPLVFMTFFFFLLSQVSSSLGGHFLASFVDSSSTSTSIC